MPRLTFTATEADILRHRLTFLAALDAEDLADLFPEHEAPAGLAEMADLAAAQLYDGPLAVTYCHPDTLLVLAEAVEGSTFLEMAKEGAQAGALSRQKLAAFRLALASAAEKIEGPLGRRLLIP